jgi:hypothetical protein
MTLPAAAAIVDRIAATVGRTVITDSEVRRLVRVTSLLARTPLNESPAAWQTARERLIEQTLVKEEIRISRYPVAQQDEIAPALEQVKSQFSSLEAYQSALGTYRITEADLKENLGWQITFARFLMFRFRPAVQLSDRALREYYARWTPEGVKPPFEQVRDKLELEYIGEESGRYLDRWLREVRQQTRIETYESQGAAR